MSNNLGSVLIGGALSGGVNYYETEWLKVANPVAGFVAGFTCNFVFGCSNGRSGSNPIVDFVLAILASAVVTKLACMGMGVSLSFETAVVLTGLSIASSFVATVILIAGLFACKAVFGK
ncbi:MAG: hypothetical protein ACHQUC_08745 [Chlamydiales bacterium]